MQKDILEILVPRDIIHMHAVEMGRKISRDYEGKELVLVSVLKGSFVFMADLMREINIAVDMDFIAVTSYGNSTTSSGVVRIIKDIDIDITGKHVLIIEDIIDSGLTLRHLKDLLYTRSPLSVKICTAFDKPSRRKVHIDIDYEGIIVPDKFIVGYGLDYKGMYRNLPDVCILKPEVYMSGECEDKEQNS